MEEAKAVPAENHARITKVRMETLNDSNFICYCFICIII